jgi:hypothetical protein
VCNGGGVLHLYDHFAAGVKRALPQARVGGPHVTDPETSDAYAAWLAMGSPQPPGAEQIITLHAAAEVRAARRDLAVEAGASAKLSVSLPRHSVKLIEFFFRPQPTAATAQHPGVRSYAAKPP